MLADIPNDAIGQIARWLPLKTILLMRLVCSAFTPTGLFSFYGSMQGLDFIRNLLHFFISRMEKETAVHFFDSGQGFSMNDASQARIIQLLPTLASGRHPVDFSAIFYKPRQRHPISVTTTSYTDPYEGINLQLPAGHAILSFSSVHTPSDPIVRIAETQILCCSQLFLQKYTSTVNCTDMFAICKTVQNWTDDAFILDPKSPMYAFIIHMIRHNPTVANVVTVALEFRASSAKLCQTFLLEDANFKYLRLMWGGEPYAYGYAASISQSRGNGIPLNVSVVDLLPFLPVRNGIKKAYLYCIALRPGFKDSDPRFVLHPDLYTMYAHDMEIWRIPGYTQLLASHPATIPITPVASVDFLVT